MSVLLAILIVYSALELLSWIVDSLKWGSETLPPPNISDILTQNYKPEECDRKMIENCQNLLQRFFKEPVDLPMAQRIEQKMKGLSNEEKKQLLSEITLEACKVMDVNVSQVIFADDPCMGYYNFEENVIMFSNAYIAQDAYNVEIVKTVFHELKHAVQFRAIGRDGNVWGYSQETLIAWAGNYVDYISCSSDPEGYFKQPLEVDSFGFECSVVPLPGFSSINYNVA